MQHWKSDLDELLLSSLPRLRSAIAEVLAAEYAASWKRGDKGPMQSGFMRLSALGASPAGDADQAVRRTWRELLSVSCL